MRVLLCGEGPHDIGLHNDWDERAKDYVIREGWMQPFVAHILAETPSFSVLRRVELQVQPRDPKKRQLPPGHGAKAYLAKRAAWTGGYDIVIFMVDTDSNDIGEWRRIVAEIERGYAALPADILCVACVPMAASESWLLSDPSAWTYVTSYDGPGFPAMPEAIWGDRHDPAGNHPHQLFSRICGAADVPDNRETRHRIAEATSLQIARARCPLSMEPFVAALATR